MLLVCLIVAVIVGIFAWVAITAPNAKPLPPHDNPPSGPPGRRVGMRQCIIQSTARHRAGLT